MSSQSNRRPAHCAPRGAHRALGRRVAFAASIVALALLSVGGRAQRHHLASDDGMVGVGLAIRQLQTVGIFMQAVAHPDDENNGLLVMLNRGLGMRTALATATRGDGGQNEIGPELGDALGVLRTAELMSMHQLDGAEQYFTRAVDFGYSFSLDETFQKWGREEIVGDFVRLMRTVRPDVVMAMRPEGTGGGQHHQASAIIVGEAFKAAGDPARFPEQLKEGLRPWQPKKLYYMESFGGAGAQQVGANTAPNPAILRVDSEVYDRVLGETFAYVGSRARSNHKSQGMAQLLALPGPSVTTYRLGDSVPATRDKNASLFDGIDATIPGLAQYARGTAPAALTQALAGINDAAAAAARAFSTQGVTSTIAPIADGLAKVRALRAGLQTMDIDAEGRAEIDFRLKTKEEEFAHALVVASMLQFDVLADDGQVVQGQPVKATLVVANRGNEPIELKRVAFDALTGDPGCNPRTIAGFTIYRCQPALRVASDVPLTTPYWKRLPNAARYEFAADVPFGAPFRPTPFAATLTMSIRGAEVQATQPVRYRYEGNVFSGEKRMDLQVVPALSVQITPDITIVPIGAARASAPVAARNPSAIPAATQPLPPDEREVRVSVTNSTKGAADAEVTLQMPQGWQATPRGTKISFTREDEVQTVRFRVGAARGTAPGAYRVKAVARLGGQEFDQGYQVIEYQHVEHHQLVAPAEATLKLVDVKVRPNVLVGYVMGVGDQVPQALQQLGARVALLTPDDLAWGNLSRYDAIVTGVRAYERRPDLRAHNQRLLQYVDAGGTLIVQYNKFEFNEAQYGPYPAKVSSNRITDENAPVQVLQPANPIFTTPNKIDASTWQGWVQERGLYFLGDKDPRYVDLVQMEDPFPYNSGAKKGALVEADYGKGHWVYVGLGLWRQLPAGTDGAYRLFANLVSLGRR
ncbi:MAG: PIG-L family deacetylase [Bacteroidales bacterium]